MKKAPASGGKLAARDLANLKTLNSRLLKSVMEQREQINQLRSEQASLAADSEILDATERDVFKFIFSGAVGKMMKKAESAIAELNSAEMRPVLVTKEKDEIERDLNRVVEERDLSRKDFDAKRKECEVFEEELRSVMLEKNVMRSSLEDGKRLVEKLGKEMEVMMSQKDVDMEVLKAEIKENAIKVEALEAECRLLKEIRGRLEDEVGEWKVSLEELREEKVELDADYAEIKKSFVIESGRFRKEKIELKNKCDVLKAGNKENALKVEALEEECRLLKEIRGKLEDEVRELKVSVETLKEENVNLFKDYAQMNTAVLLQIGYLKNEKLKVENNYDIMKARNNDNALKVSALEKECRSLKKIRGKLECEVGELKISLEGLREELKLFADYEEIQKKYFDQRLPSEEE